MIDEIKNNIKIENYIAKFVQLDEHYTGLCPFHNEKTPSFHVETKKQIFKCFGCGEGGDIIRFYQKYFNVDVKTAVKELYDFIGGTGWRIYQNKPKSKPKSYDFLSALNEAEKEFYFERLGIAGEKQALYETRARRLEKNTEIFEELYRYSIKKGGNTAALNYLLKTRKISEYVLNEKRIFTINNYNELSNHLKKCFDIKSLVDCGLFNEKGNLIFYNHRILIPYLHKGLIVYLRGRYFDSENNPVSDKFKYLGLKNDALNVNTPKRFYNRDTVAGLLHGEVIYITEGELDTAAVETMRWNACAIPGAGNIPPLKEFKLLKNKKPVLCFDNDNAGNALREAIAAVFDKLEIDFCTKELPSKDANEFLIKAA